MSRVTPDRALRESLRDAVREAFGIELAAQDIPVSWPPDAALGDLASPLCFELARRVRRAPRDVAAALLAARTPRPEIARVEVAGPGYLNAFVHRSRTFRELLAEGLPAPPEPAGPKVVVEHTNINPNKAAHIGHLRNAVLGDTLVRLLRRLGRRVEVQNYIDDTGVQVADLVVGFTQLRGEGLAEVRERYSAERLAARGERFDYVAWDLYAEVGRFYEQDPTRHKLREETLAAMERGDNPVAALAAHVAQRMVQHHLRTMARIGVRYDLLPRESDILASRFWSDAFERLKNAAAIHLVTEGKHAGCWVMDLPGASPGAGEDQKIIVRSNGTVTYVGKDIAYQLWKIGRLGRDFAYQPFDWAPYPPLYALWSTGPDPGVEPHPAFGAATTVYNVIDTRQSYLQRVVVQGLKSLGLEAEAERSIHYAYEMVALTPAAVQAMFPDYPLDESERARPYIEMAGRRGLGVRADDLIDALLARAKDEILARNPAAESAAVERTAQAVAIGALRYYMLRFSRSRVVAFDLDATLAFDGETGPYLQYSVVRARNILAKCRERLGTAALDATRLAAEADLDAVTEEARAEHWSLVLALLRTEDAMAQAVSSLELSVLAKHAHALAQAFNTFYHRYPVAQEEDPAVRALRIGLVQLYDRGATELLAAMGIDVPDRM